MNTMRRVAKQRTYEYLRLTYFVRFLGDAFFYTFLYVFLASLGFGTDKLGLVAALSPFAALLGNIVFQRLAKNLEVNRILMFIFSLVEMSIAFIFFIFPKQPFIFYAIIITCVSTINEPFYSLLDGYSGTYISERNKQYSSMRVMGTLSYVIGPLVGGFLVDNTGAGFQTLFLMSSVFYIITSFLIYYLPKQKIELHIIVPPEEKKKLKIIGKLDLIAYLIFNFFVIGVTVVTDNFFGIYLKTELGITTTQFGYIVAAAIAIEAGVMFLLAVRKNNSFRMPAFSFFFIGTFLLIRPLIIVLNLSPTLTLILSVFRGLAWGYYIVFNVRFLARVVPLKHLTKALLTGLIATTSSRIITSLIIGRTLKYYSYQQIFLCSIFVVIFGMILSMSLAEVDRRKQKKVDMIVPYIEPEKDLN
ncbi:MAG: putative 3-phenylpropionic acid transporter [Tenericutes bacterium ADurb.Bin087]|nr:MAG: putative 3-phenylpropionic acid transporter [Tenericutes bacterium ADurb.Bin087]